MCSFLRLLAAVTQSSSWADCRLAGRCGRTWSSAASAGDWESGRSTAGAASVWTERTCSAGCPGCSRWSPGTAGDERTRWKLRRLQTYRCKGSGLSLDPVPWICYGLTESIRRKPYWTRPLDRRQTCRRSVPLKQNTISIQSIFMSKLNNAFTIISRKYILFRHSPQKSKSKHNLLLDTLLHQISSETNFSPRFDEEARDPNYCYRKLTCTKFASFYLSLLDTVNI